MRCFRLRQEYSVPQAHFAPGHIVLDKAEPVSVEQPQFLEEFDAGLYPFVEEVEAKEEDDGKG